MNIMINKMNKRYVVIKRDGTEQPILFDKITTRIRNLCTKKELLYIDPTIITMNVASSITDRITTEQIDDLTSKICINLMTQNLMFGKIGARICISNLQKKTSNSFYETVSKY